MRPEPSERLLIVALTVTFSRKISRFQSFGPAQVPEVLAMADTPGDLAEARQFMNGLTTRALLICHNCFVAGGAEGLGCSKAEETEAESPASTTEHPSQGIPGPQARAREAFYYLQLPNQAQALRRRTLNS